MNACHLQSRSHQLLASVLHFKLLQTQWSARPSALVCIGVSIG